MSLKVLLSDQLHSIERIKDYYKAWWCIHVHIQYECNNTRHAWNYIYFISKGHESTLPVSKTHSTWCTLNESNFFLSIKFSSSWCFQHVVGFVELQDATSRSIPLFLSFTVSTIVWTLSQTTWPDTCGCGWILNLTLPSWKVELQERMPTATLPSLGMFCRSEITFKWLTPLFWIFLLASLWASVVERTASTYLG